MTAIIFDTLNYANKLKLVGFSEEQAEGQAHAMAELFEHNIATKSDIHKLEFRIERDMREMKKDLLLIKKDLLISIGGMIMAAVAVLPVIIKFVHVL